MRFFGVILLTLLLIPAAFGGNVDPELEAKIKGADPTTLYSTLIYMNEQLDVQAMKHQHDLLSATRAQRHFEVVTALQEIATRSQVDLLAYLSEAQGKAGSYRGFWIANMIVAEMNSETIHAVAARADVDMVYSDFKGELIKPIIDSADNPPTITNVEAGLRAVRADSMWMLGYTGQGRLVCNIDNGVAGSHPALNYKWRGANGYTPQESWLDTTDPNSQFPHDEDGHGTHTMGTICGRSSTGPDTVGVAIGAQWIAARAIVDGGNVALAFQWAADPDGNPNTIEDVPDAISNSWYVPGGGCPPTYYALIDNCEAAGAAVVFAAGNAGPGPQTVEVPANRITTPFNCFSVGAIDGNNNNYPIAGFSSRGPSQCDGQTIKPEVVAPGVNVRSSVPSGGYGYLSGTSMACPHVAGAVALLRQVNPNASVDTIKWALMQSARDLGGQGEDNNYGYGIINIKSAMALIPPIDAPYVFPNAVYVQEPNDNFPDPGETINLFVRLMNTGLPIENVAAVISTADQYATVVSDSAYYGNIAQNDTSLSADPFVISFSGDTPQGRNISFDMHITGSGGYDVTKQLSLMVGHLAEMAIANHDVGNVRFTISNFGAYGLDPAGMNPSWDGVGFKMPPTGPNNLFEGSLLIGDGPTRISNAARDQDQNISDDFAPKEAITTAEPGPFADQEHYTSFSDQQASEPLGITISQKTFAFADSPDDDYIIIEYTIANTENQDLQGVLVAHFEDWDLPWNVATDKVNFDRDRNLGYEFYTTTYRGQQVLSDLGVFSFKALDNAQEVYPPRFTMEDKWNYMNAGIADTAITTQMDCSMMITTGPYNIPPGESVVAAFAILGGTSLTDLRANADAAIARYAGMTSVDDNIIRPGEFSLLQNYPNPFNAQTTIEFTVSRADQVKLEAFDLLGRKVAVLADARMDAGPHTVTWDCSDLSSGVYFYKLTIGDKSATRKLTLLK